MDAAELLFAEHGVSAVSIRQLTIKAGVNVASAHYHFGNKENLLDEVLLRRLDALASRRAELAQALSSPPSITNWVRLLISPLLELMDSHGAQGRAYIKLHWRCQSEYPGKIEALAGKRVGPVSTAFSDRLLASLPTMDAAELQKRALLASRVAFDVLAGNVPVPMTSEELCDFLACGIIGSHTGGNG